MNSRLLFDSAPGRPATFSGKNGSKAPDAMARAESLAFTGILPGGPSPMPASARAGAFECDESCRGYTGDPRNASGPRGTPAGDHNNPHQSTGLKRSA